MGKGEIPSRIQDFSAPKKNLSQSHLSKFEKPPFQILESKNGKQKSAFFDATIGRSSASSCLNPQKFNMGMTAIDEMQLLHFNPFSHRHRHQHLVLMLLPVLKPSAVATLPQTHHAVSVPKWFSDGSPQLAPCRQ